jgi:hypothetical protein
MSDVNASNDHRWWDVYIIRYAVGIVVGALCVYQLAGHFGADFASILFLKNIVDESGVIKWSTLVLLGIYGFVYTYIASAPFLVLHAVRFLYSAKDLSWNCHYPWLIYTIIVFFSLALLAYMAGEPGCAGFLLVVGVGLLVIWQILLLRSAFSKKDEALVFYKKLYEARKNPTIDPSSYKHLREHGNAFSLVLANLFFFILIVAIHSLFGKDVIWLLLLWILPAAGVYFLGHQIESGMLNDK